MEQGVTAATGGGSDPRRWSCLAVLIFSLSIIGIDASILNVALPTLSRDLHADTAALQWMVDSYVLVFAGFLLTGGSLGDRLGRRGALVAGLVVFGSSSFAAAMASSWTQVAIARAAMGMGAALIMPATLSIITNVFREPRERARAIGVWAAVSAIGGALGPLFGGVLLAHFWWGSVFLVNVPVVVIAVPLVYAFVPTSRDPNPHRIDVVGSLCSMVGLSLLLWSIIGAPERGWTSTGSLVLFGAAIAVLAGFVLWELRTANPMLDMSFFRDPRFTVACLAITMAFFAAQGSTFMNAQMFQLVFGYTPLEAGIRMVPYILMFVLGAWMAPRINERVGTKLVVAGGLLVSASGMFIQLGVHVDSSYFRAVVGIALVAGGMGLATPPATEAIMGSVPREKAGVGSAMNDTTRLTGGALGVAVLGSILATQYRSSMGDAVHRLSVPAAVARTAESSAASVGQLSARLGGRSGELLLEASRTAWLHGRNSAALVGGIMLFGGALLAFAYLPARAPHHHLNASEILPNDIVIDDDEMDVELAAQLAAERESAGADSDATGGRGAAGAPT
jgi:EmrB/QacA subfamily drug resistance transporter